MTEPFRFVAPIFVAGLRTTDGRRLNYGAVRCEAPMTVRYHSTRDYEPPKLMGQVIHFVSIDEIMYALGRMDPQFRPLVDEGLLGLHSEMLDMQIQHASTNSFLNITKAKLAGVCCLGDNTNPWDLDDWAIKAIA